MSAAMQARFAQALLDAEQPAPSGLIAHTSPVPARRFGVYRNNVAVGLIEALRARFPAVESIVGEEFFRAMARVFIAEHPPKSPVLIEFGDELACFLEGFIPAAELPYLADVARLEAARTRAYHAADAQALDAAHFTGLDPAEIAGLRLVLHPSVHVIRSQHPIVTIWAMNAGELALAPIEDWGGEDALVSRPAQTVTVSKLPPGGAAFTLALQQGAPLAEAAGSALSSSESFDLAVQLAALIGGGLIVHIIKEPQS